MIDIYLVDCENVGTDSIGKPNAVVYYFCSNDTEIALGNREYVERVSHNGVKNALDFMLAIKLGYLLRNYERNARYVVVSNDKGFDTVVGYWQSQGYEVYRYGRAQCGVVVQCAGKISEEDKKRELVSNMLETLPKKKQRAIRNIYSHTSSNRGTFDRFMHSSVGCYFSQKEFKELCDYIFSFGCIGGNS